MRAHRYLSMFNILDRRWDLFRIKHGVWIHHSIAPADGSNDFNAVNLLCTSLKLKLACYGLKAFVIAYSRIYPCGAKNVLDLTGPESSFNVVNHSRVINTVIKENRVGKFMTMCKTHVIASVNCGFVNSNVIALNPSLVIPTTLLFAFLVILLIVVRFIWANRNNCGFKR